MQNDLISVIVPAYNVDKYLKNCILSIEKQTYQPIEIIIVDDGSKDDTLNIAKELKSVYQNIILIEQENSGVTTARLNGVKHASGKWVGFVDADDSIEPEMYETLLSHALKYHADISHCGYQMVFPNRVDYYYGTDRLVKQDNLRGLADLLAGSFIEPGLCNKLFHKTLFQSLLHTSVLDLSIKDNEDLLMNYYLFKEAKHSVFYDHCYYHYQVRKNSATTSNASIKKLEDPLKVQNILLNDTKGNHELQIIIHDRMAGMLIQRATMAVEKENKEFYTYRKQKRKELRDLLPQLNKKEHGSKTVLMAYWASYSPGSYSLVHQIYSKMKGTDKKYSVE